MAKLKWKKRKDGSEVAGPFRIWVTRDQKVWLSPGLVFHDVHGFYDDDGGPSVAKAKSAAQEFADAIAANMNGK
jgi:hypothetical protein